MNLFRRIAFLAAVVGLFSFAASTGPACPFCEGEKAPPLVTQFEDAQIVLFGHFENGKPSNDLGQGTTDFVIEKVYKDHDMVKGKARITVNRFIADSKSKFIIFCDVYKGKLDAYKGMPLVNDSEMIRYLERITKNKGKSPPERLRDAFDFLNSPESEVSMDAYREYARADYRDYKEMAKTLPADTIAGWLKDPKTPTFRYGLYASLLGHCGNADHAKMLMTMISDPERRKSSGLYGLMAAYTMLEPEKGWKFLTALVQDKEQPFLYRYAGLQTMRFLWDSRTDLLHKDEAAAKNELVKGISGILIAPDMADFAIEDLRKWKRWETSEQVMGLYGQKGFEGATLRKSILRYALQCPSPAAKRFVSVQRTRDPEGVDETLELLNLESPSAK